MNQVLDFRRLFMLIARHWFENRKAYGLFFLAIAVFLCGWFIFFLLIGNPHLFDQGSQMIIYFVGLFASGCLSAAFLFRDFSNKAKKITYQLLPAATLEKLVCVLFYGVLIFFVAYTFIFFVTDFFAVKMANSATSGLMNSNSLSAVEWRQRFGITTTLYPAKTVNIFSPGVDSFIFYPGDTAELFSAFFPIQSAFILGSVYFTKNSFFKTIVALLVMFMIFFIVMGKMFTPMFPASSQTFNSFTIVKTFNGAGDETIYSLPFWIGNIADFLVKFVITPVLWVATYYRLKENEI
ncbi:MAG TPA: hypothetical protein VG738_22695 [Chitinophagaceae bacterium]|nr:hypothetical protein [Chitinophagaceae bacterium]